MVCQYGLLGYPLRHSFSARYFADKFEREQLAAEYCNWEYADAAEALTRLRSLPMLRGFNVTIPHKQAVIPLLDSLSPEARAIGAVNVVKVIENDGHRLLLGYNTDIEGFSVSLKPLFAQGMYRQALVLGTGGASLAVCYALQCLGLQIHRVSRHTHSGRITYADLTPQLLAACTLIVNCTPLGMYPHTDQCPDLPYECLTSQHLLYDLVYNPLETLFMRRGAEHGAKVKNGLEMLHLQAEAAWKIWQA